MLKRLITLIVLWPPMILITPNVGNAQDLTGYHQAEKAAFGQEGLIPIFIPRDEKVGNVYTEPEHTFRADKRSCFPRLRLSKAQKTVAPTFTMNESVGGTAALLIALPWYVGRKTPAGLGANGQI